RPGSRTWRGCCSCSLLSRLGERAAGLEQRLQAAEDHHPADAGDAFGGLGCALELVVRDCQLAVAAFLRLDLPGDAARLLLGELGVVERAPAVYEPPRRLELERG